MRPTANPAPKTEAAREALRAFYCDLCDRGYSRINEYEAHLSSYTHTHKKNFKEMKSLQKDTGSAERRERERIREEKEMQRLMGGKGILPSTISSTLNAGFKPITLRPKPAVPKPPSISSGNPGGGGGGWKTVGKQTVKKSEQELCWGNNGEDEYDPAYPTPV